MPSLPLFPPQASTIAAPVDTVFFALCGFCGLIATVVAVLIAVFMVRYRRGVKVDRSNAPTHSLLIEASWTLPLVVIAIGFFTWTATLYLYETQAPAGALEIAVTGKQWMWKIQHPDGRREINALHVPSGRPVKLLMTSLDVIHDFFVPAFRVKQDVLPGRYTTLWFEANRPGTYHLFCAQYCGAKHSEMVGTVVVSDPAAYQAWLSGRPAGEAPAAGGARLFEKLGCKACHRSGRPDRAPPLDGVWGRTVLLSNGQTVTADENYLRESMLDPKAKIVKGYDPIMPSYQGQISEDDLLQLIAYMKALPAVKGGATP